ncbi:MAG: hypothetical protein JWP12_1369 [Bacteroidetes bacterium]|nr:hypothetical protein [Bacteroidota bacterium]
MDQKTLENTFCLLSGYPMNFILDKNGKVMEVWTEENPEADKQQGFYDKVKSLINSSLK